MLTSVIITINIINYLKTVSGVIFQEVNMLIVGLGSWGEGVLVYNLRTLIRFVWGMPIKLL